MITTCSWLAIYSVAAIVGLEVRLVHAKVDGRTEFSLTSAF